MSRESKIFSPENVISDVKHYEAFGWEILTLTDEYVVMTRETQNPVYPDLLKYETEYESLKNKIAELEAQKSTIPYVKFNFWKFCLLTLLLIVPGVVYAVKTHKSKKNNEYDFISLTEEIAEIKKKMEDVYVASKVLFFARQN